MTRKNPLSKLHFHFAAPIVAEEVEAVAVDTVAAVVTAAMEEATVTAVDMVEEPADTVVEVDTVAGLLHVVHLLLTTAVAAVEDGPEGTIVRVQDPTRLLVSISRSECLQQGSLSFCSQMLTCFYAKVKVISFPI